jgi:hypothetical protein
MFLHAMRSIISRTIAFLQHAWMGRPDCVLFFGYGLGDDLLCTGVAHELKKRGTGKIVMLSKHPALFQGNPDVAGVFKYGYPTVGRLQHNGYNCRIVHYGGYDPVTDKDTMEEGHFLVKMCRQAGVTNGTIELLPRLNLTAAEKQQGQRFEKQVVIQSAGLGVFKNKDWFVERYQAVADALGKEASVIQLGLASDPPLNGVLNLCGKTTLRESAAILANAHVFVGQVGFLMHLARAVDCRSVIVYGGRETPAVTGYAANENIVGRTECSPCWQRNRCDYDHACMKMISAEEVIHAALRQMAKFGQPLPVETANIDSLSKSSRKTDSQPI